MLNLILQIDSQATQFINALIPHNPLFDLFFSFFSMKGGSIPIWIAIVVILIIFEEKINKKFILYFLVSLVITSTVVFGMKEFIQRPRPFSTMNYELQTMNCPADFSFPSGHATIAFASAAVLAVFDKKRRYFYFLIAGLIGFSRIYLGCHYVLDVIGGGALGYFVSSFILQIGPSLIKQYKKRKKDKKNPY